MKIIVDAALMLSRLLCIHVLWERISILTDPVFLYISCHRSKRKERSKGHDELGGRCNKNIAEDRGADS